MNSTSHITTTAAAQESLNQFTISSAELPFARLCAKRDSCSQFGFWRNVCLKAVHPVEARLLCTCPGYLGQGSLNWDTGNQFSSHLPVIFVVPGGERHHCPIYYKLGSEFEEEGEKGKPRLPVANADFALVAVGTLPIPLLVGCFSESIDFTI